MRASLRNPQELRPVTISRDYLAQAEGSALVTFGNTKVLCAATVVPGVPKFLKDSGSGWLTAEYGMLPRATHTRVDREAVRGKQTGRTMEIQRLIGRSLRAVTNLKAMKDYTITVDCDVIQADGGTRTAAITGGYVALVDAARYLQKKLGLREDLVVQQVAAVSVGICQGELLVDLDYSEDCQADTDMNVVMTTQGKFIEIQGTAEHAPFDQQELANMLTMAGNAISQLFEVQQQALLIAG